MWGCTVATVEISSGGDGSIANQREGEGVRVHLVCTMDGQGMCRQGLLSADQYC